MNKFSLRTLIILFISLLSTFMVVQAETLNNVNTVLDKFENKEVTISGKSEVHLTADEPLDNATVNLVGDDAWLYFDNVKPSVVISNYLDKIKIDGQCATLDDNVRLQIYRHGTTVIPDFKSQAQTALTAYTQRNCSGESKSFGIYDNKGNETMHKGLGDGFDNNVRSFKLRKGFMAVMANNPDGTGFSRCYIADNDDVIVNDLPDGFVTKDGTDRSFVSFVRVVKWQRVSKKGMAYGASQFNELELSNATNYLRGPYGTYENPDVECVYQVEPLTTIPDPFLNHTHIVGLDEPDVHKVTMTYTSPEGVIRMWSDFERIGLRLGTPAVLPGFNGASSWLDKFMAMADSLNYRVDFMQIHSYYHLSDIKSTVDNIYSIGNGRPVWITEYNSGNLFTLNYYEDYWIDKSGIKCDADGNQIPGGKQVDLPNTVGNADVQYRFIKKVLEDLDADNRVERHYIYNRAGGDARSLFIEGKMTKAGKYFSDFKADFAYRDANRYDHVWKIAPPFIAVDYTEDNSAALLSWYDHNGETGINYEVYVKADDGDYKLVATLEPGKDYEFGGTVKFSIRPDMEQNALIKVHATSYKNEKSLFSREKKVEFKEKLGDLKWTTKIENYKSIRLSTLEIGDNIQYTFEKKTEDGEFMPIYSGNKSRFSDTEVVPGNTYYYRAIASGFIKEPIYSDVLEIYLPNETDIPNTPVNIYAGGGNGRVNLMFNAEFDTKYEIYRSDAQNGVYERIVTTKSGQYTDDTVVNGTTYYYYLKPLRGDIEGECSEIISATPEVGNTIYIPFIKGETLTFFDLYQGKTYQFDGWTRRWTSDRHGNYNNAVIMNAAERQKIVIPVGRFNADDFTIAMWIKPGTEKMRLFEILKADGDKYNYLDYDGEGNWTYGCVLTIRNAWRTDPLNDWTHLVCTHKDGVCSIYLNGELVNSATGVPSLKLFDASNLYFLTRDDIIDADCGVDDIYVLNHGVGGDEVKQLMGRSLTNDVITLPSDSADEMTIAIAGKTVTITAASACDIAVYSIDGRVVGRYRLNEGMNTLPELESGIYFIGNHKIMIK